MPIPPIPPSITAILRILPGTNEEQSESMKNKIVERIAYEFATKMESCRRRDWGCNYQPTALDNDPMLILRINAQLYQQTLRGTVGDSATRVVVGASPQDGEQNVVAFEAKRGLEREVAVMTLADHKTYAHIQPKIVDLQKSWSELPDLVKAMRLPRDPHGMLLLDAEQRRRVHEVDAGCPLLGTNVFALWSTDQPPSAEDCLVRMCCVCFSFLMAKGGVGKAFPKSRDSSLWQQLMVDMAKYASYSTRIFRQLQEVRDVTNAIRTRRQTEGCAWTSIIERETSVMDALWPYLDYRATRSVMLTCTSLQASGKLHGRELRLFLRGTRLGGDADRVEPRPDEPEPMHAFSFYDHTRKECVHSERYILELDPSVGRRLEYGSSSQFQRKSTFEDTVVPKSITSAKWKVKLVRDDTGETVPGGVVLQEKSAQSVREVKREHFRPLRVWFKTQSRLVADKHLKFRLHVTLKFKSELCIKDCKFKYVTTPFRLVGKIQSAEAWERHYARKKAARAAAIAARSAAEPLDSMAVVQEEEE